ncbi:flagellar biosynthesis protein FlhF [Spirochaetia bacterium]|nr:flagellar biosynthesis protein FlhF [Spirochaetia bacterium]
MEEFAERALTYDECLDKIWAKYGKRAQVVTRRTVMMGGFMGLFMKEGVELSGYVPNTYGLTPAGVISYRGNNGARGIGGGAPAMAAAGNTGSAPAAPRANALPEPGSRSELGSHNEPLDFEEEKKKILAATGNSALPTILKTLEGISEKLEVVSTAAAPAQADHANLSRLKELLVLNDFSAGYQARLLERVRKECSLEILENFDSLQDKALEWIGESISIYKEKPLVRSPRVMILVGPTGVGKTTTIAKLAAIFGLSNKDDQKPLEVRMITIDALRIGARAQIEAYGEIMGFPVSYVDNREDLRKQLALYAEGVDLILIDTFGKSPRDSVKIGEMKQILDACGTQAEVHLAMTAATKSKDLLEIMRQFEPFNYRSVLITKQDETGGMGNVISALAEKGKSVSYITDGQGVPSDIQRANVVQFLTNLEGFRVNRQKIEEKFPVDKSDQNQWR